MNKSMNLKNICSGKLRPLQNNSRPVTFRQLIKFRNPSDGLLPMPAKMTSSQTNFNSGRNSRYSSTGGIEQSKQAQSPIKKFVKEQLNKKDSKDIPQTSKMSAPKLESKIQSDPCNQSRVFSSTNLEQSMVLSSTLKKSVTLEDLRKKVQHLLELNVERCKLMKGTGQISTWIDQKKAAEVENQLLSIQECLRQTQEDQQNINQIIGKIQILQAAIAGQVGQSQSMKKCYYSQKNQFYNTTSHKNKHALRDSLKFNVKTMNNSLVACQQQLRKDILKCSSTSKQFYKAPNRQYYVTPVRSVKKYEPCRLQMPTTSYAKDFLNYQTLPTFPKHVPQGRSSPQAPLAVKNSTYQLEHNHKIQSNIMRSIDYRQLDCTKNKIKNIEISFTENCRKRDHKGKMNKSHLKENVINFKQARPKFENAGACYSVDQYFKSEQQREFLDPTLDKDQSGVYRAVPKNKQLLKLKENFRLLAQAL